MGFLGDLFSAKNQFRATGAPLQQTDYGQALQGGIQGQQGLIKALQEQMLGGGPNLAQTQLQNALNQQNQQAAGLIGSQRGLNPQLAARQILQAAAANNQAAANQSAQLQQQQQLMAQQQLGNVLGQQVGTLGGLQNAQNALNVQQNLGVQGINAGVAQQNAQNAQQGIGTGLGVLGGIGQALAGVPPTGVQGKAHGGEVEVPILVSPGEKVVPPGGDETDGAIVPGKAKVSGDSPKNDTVPMMAKPGTIVVPRTVTKKLDPIAVQEFMAAVRGEKSSGYKKVVDARKRWKGGKI